MLFLVGKRPTVTVDENAFPRRKGHPRVQVENCRTGNFPRPSGQKRTPRPERRTEQVAVVVERRKLERREKVSRRRQIDPTTCERDYSTEEIEFMHALDRYKRASGRMFPTCSEMLEVIRSLGYAKLNPAVPTETETNSANG